MNSKLPFIHKGDMGNMDFSTRVKSYKNTYMYIFFFLIAIFFFLLISRLFQLTVVKGNYYHSLSEENRIREVTIESKRGKIVDRKGYVLAENSDVELSETLKRITSKRYYHDAIPSSHVIGYRQVADKSDIENDTCLSKLKLGDKVGKKGIEKVYECELRGKNGKKLIEVNAQGAFKRTLNVLEAENGKNIQLSLDNDLQKRAYEIIQDKRAVVVAIKPSTGEVLVLTSSPAFDPQVFEDNNTEEIMALLQDDTKPLFNRATEGTYPPGSVFKQVIAAAGLEEKKIDKDTIIKDTGKITAGTTEFGTWNYLEHGNLEGDVDVVKALQRSNDIFFYKIGEEIGPEKMKFWAEKFGYQRQTGIGIGESIGTIPSPFWKQDVLNEQWFTGDTYNFSIGQGFVLATPLQVALATVPFANDGKYCEPSLIKEGTEFWPGKHCKQVGMSKETLETIKEGMKMACEVGGTGWPLFNFRVWDPTVPMPTATPVLISSESGKLASTEAVLGSEAKNVAPTPVPLDKIWDPSFLLASGSAQFRNQTKAMEVGCKTGTAESNKGKKPYAWFTAFAPYDNPEILVTVMVEEAGQGSDIAAPISREIFRTYFERVE